MLEYGSYVYSDEFESPRTQKAKGVVELLKHGFPVPEPFIVALTLDGARRGYEVLCRMMTDAFSTSVPGAKKIFARPCPIRPRHGFVESRLVESPDDAAALLEEAKTLDHDAELLLMPYVEAVANAIVTRTTIAVAPGHAGATAGERGLLLPWLGPAQRSETEYLHREAGIREDEQPFYEVVFWPNDQKEDEFSVQPFFTQLRAGPAVPPLRDMVPRRIIVRRVVVVDTKHVNLLDWEREVARLDPACDVVAIPGASLSCHAAVHALARGLAVFTSRIPSAGETLEPTLVLPPCDYHAVLDGIGLAFALPLPTTVSQAMALRFALFGIHNAAALTGDHSFWVGLALGLLARVPFAVLLGELRHGGRGIRKALVQILGVEPSSRTEVYEAALTRPPEDLPPLIQLALVSDELFLAPSAWREQYGGRAWAQCARAWRSLFYALKRFSRAPHHATYSLALQRANYLITLAHNNGWWLNKLVSRDDYTDAANNEVRFVAQAAYFAFAIARNVDFQLDSLRAEAHAAVGRLQTMMHAARRNRSLVQATLQPIVHRVQACRRGETLHIQIITNSETMEYDRVDVDWDDNDSDIMDSAAKFPSAAGTNTQYAVLPVKILDPQTIAVELACRRIILRYNGVRWVVDRIVKLTRV